MNKKFYIELIYLIFLLIFYSIISYHYSYDHINSHWTAVYDDEMVIAYNSLLFNSAVEQEYTDHSGYFTILLTSIYLKILNYFDLIQVFKISQIENLSLNEIFTETIYHMRIFSVYIIILTGISATYLFNILFKNKFISFSLGVILFFLYGNLLLINSVRTEQLAIFLLIFSLIGFYKYLEKNKFYYLIVFFFFLFCSIFNKSQVIYHVPFILLFSFFIKNKNISSDNFIKDGYNKKNVLKGIYIFIFLFLTFKSLIFLKDYKSWFLLINLLIVINYFIFKGSIPSKKMDNLIILNGCLIFAYVLFNSVIFLHPSGSLISLEKTIFSVVNHTAIYRNDISQVGFLDFVFKVCNIIFSNYIYLFKKFFLSINTYSLIIVISISILFLTLKRYNFKNQLLILSLFFSFFTILSINLIRGDSINYYPFSDYVLVIMVGSILSTLNKKLSYGILVSLVCLTIYFSNYKFYSKVSNFSNRTDQLCNELVANNNNNFMVIWHKKIPFIKFKEFCSA